MSQISVNGRFLSKSQTGVTRVGYELVRALIDCAQEDDRFRLTVKADTKIWTSAAQSLHTDTDFKNWSAGAGSRLGEQMLLPFQAGFSPLLCFCNVYPVAAARPVLWLHDAQVLDTPLSYERLYRLWHQTLFRIAVLRRIPIVTISEYSRNRLIHHGASPSRVHIIANGGDHLQRVSPETSILARHGLAATNFVLLVGSRAPHKNIPFAVKTLSATLDPSIKIAVVGLHQAGKYQLEDSLISDARLLLLPPITDGELRALYKAASLVVLPSFFEGFGLPVVEAMWEGAPLALSNRAALPEVGGDAALYFDPACAKDLADTVTRAMTPDMSAQLRASSMRRRERFTWQAAARKTLDLVLEEMKRP